MVTGRRGLQFVLALLLLPVALPAQPSTVLSINPVLPLLGHFQAELEQRIAPNRAVALGLSSYDLFNPTTSVDAKFRFYPQEQAPHGLGLAAGVGLAVQDGSYNSVCAASPATGTAGCGPPLEPKANRIATMASPAARPTIFRYDADNRTVAFTVSIEAHYQWLLGRTRRTAVGLGFGGRRYFSADFPSYFPTGRLTVGWAFGKR